MPEAGGLADVVAKLVTASLWAISIGWLSASPRVHRRPIEVVVFHPPAHSYAACATGVTTATPLVRDSRSSRTRESSRQISCARGGYGPNCLTTF